MDQPLITWVRHSDTGELISQVDLMDRNGNIRVAEPREIFEIRVSELQILLDAAFDFGVQNCADKG